jgi:hypothetical protein
VESVENSNREFPTLSTGLGNPANCAGFPHFHRADGGFYSLSKGEENMKPKLHSG